MMLIFAWAIEPALYLGVALLIARYGFGVRKINPGTHRFLLVLFAVVVVLLGMYSPTFIPGLRYGQAATWGVVLFLAWLLMSRMVRTEQEQKQSEEEKQRRALEKEKIALEKARNSKYPWERTQARQSENISH
jgi:hypothetical protein